MELQRPLIYLLGIGGGRYVAEWPAYVIGDSPQELTFTVEFSGSRELLLSPAGVVADPARAYATRLTRQRLHQRAFRLKVLRAYRETCAVCRLKQVRLLDAAHIVRDSDPLGIPSESNGLALCKLHHAAFDQNILGVRPDYVVEIRSDVLDEVDGPMLVHGLQGFQGSGLIIPRRPAERPNRELLEIRYEEFRSAS
jgi:putative restriction endonuclease